MKKLPKTLYIRREVDGDTSYLVVEEKLRDTMDNNEKRIVGIYDLVEKREVTAELSAPVVK